MNRISEPHRVISGQQWPGPSHWPRSERWSSPACWRSGRRWRTHAHAREPAPDRIRRPLLRRAGANNPVAWLRQAWYLRSAYLRSAAPGQQHLGLLDPLHGHKDRLHLSGQLPLGSVSLVCDGCPYAQGSERRAPYNGQQSPKNNLHDQFPPRFPFPFGKGSPEGRGCKELAASSAAVSLRNR